MGWLLRWFLFCSWFAVVACDLGVCVLRLILVALCYLDCIWFGDLVSRVYWLEWCLLAVYVVLLVLLV